MHQTHRVPYQVARSRFYIMGLPLFARAPGRAGAIHGLVALMLLICFQVARTGLMSFQIVQTLRFVVRMAYG
jgi:hypothetical protein